MVSQIAIALLGAIAIWLTQQQNEQRKKYACLFGLAGQPFWLYSSMQAEQWGIFFLSFVYAGVWVVGIKNYWLSK